MKKRLLSLGLCLVLVVGLFSGLTVNASASRIDDLKKEIIRKVIQEKIDQFKEEFKIPDLDLDAILKSLSVEATEGDFGENNCLHWEVKDSLRGKTLTISGKGAMPDFNFPEGNLAPWWNYKALGLIRVSGFSPKFDLEGDLKKVVIQDGVTNVSNYALFLLPAAEQITLPESVTSIDRYGIALCAKLKGISLPKAVTAIGDFGLAGNSFTAVSLPDGLQALGRGAFDACASLSGMTLPAAITAVPDKCFNDCTKLLTVDYKGEVTAIGERAFEGCKSLTKAPIPAAVTELGGSAFNGSVALTDVTLPGGVTAVPDGCFQDCTALADMKLPATVTSVGHNAFTGCKALKDVRTYTCTVCGQTRTEIIPATGSAVCPGGTACPSFRFRDVPAPSNWAHEGIDYCVRHGLMSGFDATTFSPDTVSTRAQIVMILYNLSGDTTDYSKYYVPFTDVRPSTWYYNAVAWGYDKDIVAGMSTTTFAPDGLITREQMAVLLYGYTEKYAPAYLGGAASLNGFPDAASVSNWAYAAMSWAVGNGLISGIASNGADYLAPSGGATRAQIAAIMMRYCRLTGL